MHFPKFPGDCCCSCWSREHTWRTTSPGKSKTDRKRGAFGVAFGLTGNLEFAGWEGGQITRPWLLLNLLPKASGCISVPACLAREATDSPFAGRCQDGFTSSLLPGPCGEPQGCWPFIHPVFLAWKNLSSCSLAPVPSPSPNEAVVLSSFASTFPHLLLPFFSNYCTSP